jgi:hypothetical protein
MKLISSSYTPELAAQLQRAIPAKIMCQVIAPRRKVFPSLSNEAEARIERNGVLCLPGAHLNS